ncbi:DUF1206 domain-containing protein [Pseudarthrobacter sp. J75]|uniref:DUF1206 domain-containing protein n=1 Tax=unclassified Pseudarthrobacter TaxID=2647000 RepID=UPI002E80E4C2|nr:MULTISPECIES: DUF1206 domain-containing protein [unclassified Pseudarthrobacter]MEE2524139.1 DUF1206 domain-containing protein [Pseudarthrobacter sp. J47]MEE2530418.1 DUF1206 domain-containing protein [Pseudarthrobacter sp. J75]
MKQAADKAEDVTNSRVLEAAARIGFAVSGILHLLIGFIAIRLAVGGNGRADVSGAVSELASQPAGPLLLWSSFVACAALALWQASDAIFDFGHLPKGKKAGAKLKAAGQALVFAGLAATLASFAVGTGSSADNSRSATDLTLKVLTAPGGVALLVAIGLGVAVAGAIYGFRGVRKSFAKHLNLPQQPGLKRAVVWLGVTGYVAKGSVLLLTGVLVVVATLRAHPEESTGLDGGLKSLRDQPFGVYLLAAVGLGLICYGVYMVVRARLARM